MTTYNPAALLAYPNSIDLVNLFKADGLTTGFGVFTDPITPSVFTSWTNFKNTCKENGFFTGYIAKAYYNPLVAETLMAASMLMDTGGGHVTIDGIEYKMRTEGVTTGDFSTPSAGYAPGMAPCDILQTLSDEGFTSGSSTFISEADPALVDSGCIDGRVYGSGCMTPTMLHLGRLTVTSGPQLTWGAWESDTVTVNYPFDARLTIYLSMIPTVPDHQWGVSQQGGPHEHKDTYIMIDSVTLLTPRFYSGPGTDNRDTPVTDAPVAVADISANVDHLIELHSRVDTAPEALSYYVDAWIFVVKQD